MRIRRLRIRDIKRHAELDVQLAEGLTVIRGPNEAGKSTIQRALELALFRRATSAGQEMDGVRRWGASGDAPPSVVVEFEHEGADGLLRKTFAGQRGVAELRLDGEVITDPAAIDQRLADLTGIHSEKFFRSTASVRHQELHDLTSDESALRDRLQISMSGADRGTSSGKRKLGEAIHRYEAAGPKNPGLLKVGRADVAELEAQVAAGDEALERLERDREALTSARAARAAAEEQLEADRASLATAERAVALLAKQRAAQARYERYRRATELRDAIAEMDASHPSRIQLPVLRAGVERLRRLEGRISELRGMLAAEPDVSGYDIAIPSPRWRPFAILSLVLVVVGLFAALGGLTALLGGLGLIVGLVLVAAGAASAWWAIQQRRLGSDVRRQNELREGEIARRLAGRSTLEQELKDGERDRDGQLSDLGLEDLEAAEVLLAAESEHVAAIDALRAEYRGVLGDEKPTDDVARLRDAAAAEVDQAVHALAGLGEIGEHPEASRDRFTAAVQRDQFAREQAVRDEAHAQARVDQNPIDAEEVALVSERLVAARERLDAHERRVRVLRGTLDALEAAEQATMKKAARFLERRMADDVALITDGRYRQVKVDENALAMSVFSAERGDWVDVTQLSFGTLDQVYLAARLGLVRQVTGDRRPPLVFDDPFITFDDARAERALRLLRRIADDHQVIYLTSSDRYDSVADAVVELPAPEERDLPAGEAADQPASQSADQPART